MNKNPIMRSILYTLSGLFLLTGCTKELTESGSRNDGKIRISFSTPMITDETATPPTTGGKAIQSSPRASIAENTTVRVVAYLSGGMTYVADQTYYMNSGGELKPCTVDSDGTFEAIDMQNELALIPDQYDFYAITPALSLNEDKKTVTVPNGVDYASSVTSNITVNSDQTLTLTQLSRKTAKIALEIKKAADNTDMTALKINPSGNGVTISALPASQNITLNADIPAATGAATLTIPASSFTLNGTTATTYLLPRLGTNRMKIDYDLTYTVSGTEESKTVSGSTGNTVLEKGKKYTFTLTMRKTGASLTVIDWIESNQDVVAGQELDYTDNGKPWFLMASRDALNPVDGTATMNWYMANGVYDATYNPSSLSACPVGWRVPTSEDAVLLYALKNAIPNDQYKSVYWTSQSASTDNAWIYRFTDGYIGSSSENNSIKTSNNALRCIRETAIGKVKYPHMASDGRTIVVRDNAGGVNMGAIRDNWTKTSIYGERNTDNALSRQFQIAKEDCNSINASGVANLSDKYTYTNASNACAVYSEIGSSSGTWRFPVQRELMLILFMYQKGKLSGVTAPTTTEDYWSATYEQVNNNAWRLSFMTGVVTTAPYGSAFKVRCVRDADLTVASSTLVADYAQWGNSFTKSIAFNSIGGAVSVKSINNGGADKNWLTSAVISGSGTSGQVQITYKPTAGNAGAHNDVTITLVNQAGTTRNITVKYDNGFIPSSILSANGWTTSLPTNGVQIAKMGNKLPSATADANWDNELMQWTSVSSTNVPLAQEQGYGKGATNTTAIITALGADGVAASKCRSLGANWYLPTLNELIVIQTCQLYLGLSYAFNRTTNNFYWSSSEQATGTISAWRLPMYTIGGGSTNTKTDKNYVRAMMNL